MLDFHDVFIFLKFSYLSNSLTNLVPNDFQTVLTKFTRDGYRVIAVATKRLDLTLVKAQRIER